MENILKSILNLQTYAEENPFVAWCYLKLIGSLVDKIQKDVSGMTVRNIECSSLIKSLSEKAPNLTTNEISTAKEQISQAKRAIESSVAAYEDSLEKREVGNLDTVIDRILKDKAGDDEVFKMVISFTDILLSGETSSGKNKCHFNLFFIC
ncbi:hypothetical protein RF11_07667 [Thelohanellus kitauei]|uniref:Uncharacterized protein n=1 Tax=Thelohanellus kitauei TaxID=669202 RepID=A0A0C2N0C6_THEKT|nr:hypothetical protein RF11_07667 [Thelohanellus kitauei]